MPGVIVLDPVTVASGSVMAVHQGPNPVGMANPLWVTGSVYVLNQGAGAGSNVTSLTGSVVAILKDGNPVADSNRFPITGSVSLSKGVDVSSMPNLSVTNVVSITGTVHMADVSAVTGTVALTRGVDVASMPLTNVTGSVSVWGVSSVTGTVHLADVSAVTGTVALARGVDVATMPGITVLTGSVVAILNAGNPVATSNPLPVQHTSGSQTGLLVGANPVATSNPLPTKETRSVTPTVTSLTASVTSQQLFAANVNRLGMTIYNDSTANMYLKFGGSVATNDFSIKLFADDYYEVPYGHVGRVDAIWTAATGSARMTEFT